MADAAEYQSCYIWQSATDEYERPTKRTKSTKSTISSGAGPRTLTLPLLRGKEVEENVQRRSDLFDAAWQAQERIIDDNCHNTIIETVEAVIDFVCNEIPYESAGSEIPSGLITIGSSSSSYANLVSSISTNLKLQRRVVVVNLVPTQVSNLKSALKLINSHATGSDLNVEDDDQPKLNQPGRRLNYDLQILSDHVQAHALEAVILAFHDSEAFEGPFLNDLIEVISSWTDRIPFICLFAMRTSVEFLQEKLPQKMIRRLRGRDFDVAQVDFENLFRAVSSFGDHQYPRLGPGVSNMILHAQQVSVQSASFFKISLQYAYMSHYFASSLSVLLQDPLSPEGIQAELCESVRNLNSFRQLVEEELSQNNVEIARLLLDDDNFLHKTIERNIARGRETLADLVTAIDLLFSIRSHLGLRSSGPWSSLYIEAMSGSLRDSEIIKDSLLAVRKLPSDAMAEFLIILDGSKLSDISVLIKDLERVESEKDTVGPLRSKYDTHHQSLRTTVVAHKVELSKHKSSLTKDDLSYSGLVNRIYENLRDYFRNILIHPKDLFLHEILIYDLKSPQREVFAPKPRHALERALSSPRDYLGCSCCKGVQHGLSGTHPATSVLYQLYLESGALINIADLWSAFYTIIGPEDTEDKDAEQQTALALFFRGLAELRYMGIIKSSKRKPDHLAKMLWNGL